MAIKRMKTLTFKLPDYNETYSFIQEDTTLTVKGAAADAQATGNAIAAAMASGSRAERQSGMLVTEQTNLYDKTTRSVDTGISATTGNEVSKNGWDVSDYIPVTGGSTYLAKVWNSDINAWSTAPITNSTATLYAVYDAEKTFIESGVAAPFTTDGITIPAGASYLRLMCRKNTIATAPEWIVVAEKEHFPESFIAYGSYNYEYSSGPEHTITGETPVIVAESGHSYICGAVSSLSFTPSSTGLCSVRFSTLTSVDQILTVPNVLWPSWFNPDRLVQNATYELNIKDGTYGVVGVWV